MGKRARPRRGAFGLQGRIVGAVLLTTVATLGGGRRSRCSGRSSSRCGTPRRGRSRARSVAPGPRSSGRPGPFTRLDLALLGQATVKPAVAAGSGSGAATGGAAHRPEPRAGQRQEEQSIATAGADACCSRARQSRAALCSSPPVLPRSRCSAIRNARGQNARPRRGLVRLGQRQVRRVRRRPPGVPDRPAELQLRLDRRHRVRAGRDSVHHGGKAPV